MGRPASGLILVTNEPMDGLAKLKPGASSTPTIWSYFNVLDFRCWLIGDILSDVSERPLLRDKRTKFSENRTWPKNRLRDSLTLKSNFRVLGTPEHRNATQ